MIRPKSSSRQAFQTSTISLSDNTRSRGWGTAGRLVKLTGLCSTKPSRMAQEKKAGQGSPRSICRHRPIFSGQTAELRGNVSATDGGDRFLVQANPVPPEVTFRLPN